MASRGRQILEALRDRLETILESAGYDTTVKRVIYSFSEPTLNIAETDLPLIEIVKRGERYEHEATSTYWTNMQVWLYIVAPKYWEDGQMEDFVADIRGALYGGTSDASGNTGIKLGGVVESIYLVDSDADLNMIESNRTYLLKIELRYHGRTYAR